MGLFFKTESLRDAIAPVLANAFTTDPKNVVDPQQTAAQQAHQIAGQVKGTFSWARLALAILLLVLLFVGAIYTGRDPALKDLYTVLVHGFEVGLGGVPGLVVGEAAARG